MHTRRAAAVTGAAGAALALGLLFAALVLSYRGQLADQTAMLQIGALTGHHSPTGGVLARIQLPILLACGCAVTVICALRRSWRLFAHAALVVLGTTVLAALLKYGLQRPEFGIGALANSFPSNTVAAFTAVALAFAAVVPRAIRGLTVVIGGAGLAVVSASVIALQWHRPSDATGGFLLAVAVAAAVELLLPTRDPAPR
ncbi:phosphatase PAP2 family protein [Gordonia iterans]